MPAGTLARVPPLVVHGFRNESDAEARFLNLHAPGQRFADYLRAMRDGRSFPFDQHDPPEDGGRPTSEAVVGGDQLRRRPARPAREAARGHRGARHLGDRGASRRAFPRRLHLHPRHVESFYVLEGEMTFTVGRPGASSGRGHLGAGAARHAAHVRVHGPDEVRFLNAAHAELRLRRLPARIARGAHGRGARRGAGRVRPGARLDACVVDTERPGRTRYDDIVDAITAWHPDCRASQVFGMPCVKRSGRVVFGLSRTGMVFKLTDPEVHARALAVPGAHLFDPSGQRGALPAVGRRAARAGRRVGAARARGGRPGSFDQPVSAGVHAPSLSSAHDAKRHARCVNQQARSPSR